MRPMRAFALAVLVVTLAAPAFAQKSETVVQEPDRVVTLKTTAIDFTYVRVEGDLQRPNGSFIKPRPKGHTRNLIELRGNFRPELARTASRLP